MCSAYERVIFYPLCVCTAIIRYTRQSQSQLPHGMVLIQKKRFAPITRALHNTALQVV